jgi:hypothetical protein
MSLVENCVIERLGIGLVIPSLEDVDKKAKRVRRVGIFEYIENASQLEHQQHAPATATLSQQA